MGTLGLNEIHVYYCMIYTQNHLDAAGFMSLNPLK